MNVDTPRRQLVVCCDGTWNTPEQDELELPAPTNVAAPGAPAALTALRAAGSVAVAMATTAAAPG